MNQAIAGLCIMIGIFLLGMQFGQGTKSCSPSHRLTAGGMNVSKDGAVHPAQRVRT